MRILIILPIFTYIISVNPAKAVIKSKNPLPYFRRQVEEITDDIPVEKVTEDSRGKLLSLFVKNVKELFNDITDDTEPKDYSTVVFTSETLTPTVLNLNSDDLVNIEHTTTMYKLRGDDLITIEHSNENKQMLYENLSVTALDRELDDLFTKIDITETTSQKILKEKVKELKSFEKSDVVIQEVTPLLTSISSYVLEPTDIITVEDQFNKTCISCNNVLTENCNNPKNKLIPSVVCERENDLCYSLHTPFGIIDRGCFNVNHNLTTYVCSCNLCNYISLSEMPFFFSRKRDWVNNVVELSRTRHFRKSIFKDMSCLRCEVNTTIRSDTMVDSANCLEGNIASLPIQKCQENEICGVKAVRSDGYIWRGCIRGPLYNYWWALCDRDLCNYDTLVSIYDYKVS